MSRAAPTDLADARHNGGGEQTALVPDFSSDAAEVILVRRALRRSDARLEALLSAAGDLVIEHDRDGTYLEVWTKKHSLLVAPREELLGKTVCEALGDEIGRGLLKAIGRTLKTGNTNILEYSLTVPAGTLWFQARMAPVPSPGRQPTVCMLVRDVTAQHAADAARQAAEEELRHEAMYDRLTGLPNRALFFDRLGHELKMSRRSHRVFTVLMLDVDHFKEINDTLGHHAGDEVLKQLGPPLIEATREGDSIARIGGDEFAILLPGASVGAAKGVASRLEHLLEEPMLVDGLPLNIDISVGAACFPEDGDDIEVLLSEADLAMYLSKDTGRGFSRYEPSLDRNRPEMLALVGELRGAMERGELVLYFQPQVSLATDEVLAAEALIRWLHPQRGLVPPDEFIPLVQETSLIKPLTYFVLDEALRQCREWADRGRVLRVGVNLAMRNVIDESLPKDVALLLHRHGVPPQRLELEITESSIMAEPRRAEHVLAALDALGVRISIDDFGTGYSSLTYLMRLPIKEVKIDRSFVTKMADDSEREHVVRSTIELVSNLGKEVVAEGVETADVMNRLKDCGCHLAQGYCFSRPMPAAEFMGWLDKFEASRQETCTG